MNNNYDSKKVSDVAERVLNELIINGELDGTKVFKDVMTEVFSDFTITIATASAVCLRNPHEDLKLCAKIMLDGFQNVDELHEMVSQINDEALMFAIERAVDNLGLGAYLND